MSSGPAYTPQTEAEKQLQARNGVYDNKGYNNAMAGFAQGGMSNADAIGALKSSIMGQQPADQGGGGGDKPNFITFGAEHLGQQPQQNNGGAQFDQALQNLATGSATGSRFATNEVMSNPLLMQGLNSVKGQLDMGQGMEGEQKDIMDQLQHQGFQLTPQDHEAYGQASGNIARMFGQQENSLSQSLADRGLASAPSGAAGAGFSGLMGNKNEQLAQAQMQIANDRMNNTMKRIGQQQQFIGQLNGQNNQAAGNYASLGQNAINQQYERQLQGAGMANTNVNSLSNAEAQGNKSQYDAQQTAGPGIGGVLGGLATGGLAAATGGLGAGVGAGLAKGIFGGGGSTGGSGGGINTNMNSYYGQGSGPSLFKT